MIQVLKIVKPGCCNWLQPVLGSFYSTILRWQLLIRLKDHDGSLDRFQQFPTGTDLLIHQSESFTLYDPSGSGLSVSKSVWTNSIEFLIQALSAVSPNDGDVTGRPVSRIERSELTYPPQKNTQVKYIAVIHVLLHWSFLCSLCVVLLLPNGNPAPVRVPGPFCTPNFYLPVRTYLI